MLILVYLFIYRMTQLPHFLHVHEFVLLLIFPTLNMLAYTKKYSKILIFECLLNNYITDKSQPVYIFIIVLHFSNSKVSSKLYCRFRKSPFFCFNESSCLIQATWSRRFAIKCLGCETSNIYKQIAVENNKFIWVHVSNNDKVN